MLVTLGEANIKTSRIWPICATDDLAAGASARIKRPSAMTERVLTASGLTKNQVEDLSWRSRVKAGWITEADLAPEPAEGEGEEGATPDASAETGRKRPRQTARALSGLARRP